jgi:hypothetical protein
LSSGISANILDFSIPQKHVLTDMTAQEAARKAGGAKSRPVKANRSGVACRGQELRRFRQREARK